MNYYLNKLMTYHEVHKMYREGNSIRKISEHLGLNWRTVKKLLSKDDRSYQKELEQPISKKKLIDPFRDFVREKLELYHDTSAAQMFDWLKEQHPDFPSVSAKTVFNFVQGIRAEFNIPKVSSARDFQMVEELPYGSQAQVDFGFIIRPPQQISKREYNSLLSFYRAAVISSFCLVIFLLPRQWLLMHMNKLFILLLLCLKKSFMIRTECLSSLKT